MAIVVTNNLTVFLDFTFVLSMHSSPQSDSLPSVGNLSLSLSGLVDVIKGRIEQFGIKVTALSFRDLNDGSKTIERPDHTHGRALIRSVELGSLLFQGCSERL